jgi:hypothetical protein
MRHARREASAAPPARRPSISAVCFAASSAACGWRWLRVVAKDRVATMTSTERRHFDTDDASGVGEKVNAPRLQRVGARLSLVLAFQPI